MNTKKSEDRIPKIGLEGAFDLDTGTPDGAPALGGLVLVVSLSGPPKLGRGCVALLRLLPTDDPRCTFCLPSRVTTRDPSDGSCSAIDRQLTEHS